MMKYQKYKVEDFLQDDFFVRWVLHNDKETTDFWEGWLVANPGKHAEVQQAREYIEAFKSSDGLFAKEEVDLMWNNITAEIDSTNSSTQPKVRSINRRLWWSVAASVGFFFVTAAIFIIIHHYFPIVERTNFTQRRNIVLPDGSKVMLNTNSSISYKRFWFLDKTRQVKLSGEAFFNVVHTSRNRPFSVSSDGLKVEVLGTAFNIREYDGKAKVLLEQGKVQLQIKNGAELIIRPGELVDITSISANQYSIHTVNSSIYTAWKTGEMIFVETPLTEIIDMLETTYGYRVQLTDSSLMRKKVTTRVFNDNVDILLELLEESLPAKIVKQNKTINIYPGIKKKQMRLI